MENKAFKKDNRTGFIENVSTEEYNKYLSKRNNVKKNVNEKKKTDNEINSLKSQVDELKSLVSELIREKK